MKRILLFIMMFIMTSLSFAQTIYLNGDVHEINQNRTPKAKFIGYTTAEWNVVEYAGQRYTMLSIKDPTGQVDGWGEILFPGCVWEVITDPYKEFSGTGNDVIYYKSFLVYDPKDFKRAVIVEWANDKNTNEDYVAIRLCNVKIENNLRHYDPHHILMIRENATKVFATDIMNLLNTAVSKGILTQKIRQ